MSERKKYTLEDAKRAGEAIGIRWESFDVEQFCIGMNVETEHGMHDPETDVVGDDEIKIAKIAWAHLKEFPDYYDRLEKMEEEAEEYWRNKK